MGRTWELLIGLKIYRNERRVYAQTGIVVLLFAIVSVAILFFALGIWGAFGWAMVCTVPISVCIRLWMHADQSVRETEAELVKLGLLPND